MIIKKPNNFEPAYQISMPFLVSSPNVNNSEFRYGFEVVTSPTQSGVYSRDSIVWSYPVNNQGIYSPHKVLQNGLSYDFNPYILSMVDCPNSQLYYKIGLWDRWNPNVFFNLISESLGNELILNNEFNNFGSNWSETSNVEFLMSFGPIPARVRYLRTSGSFDGKLQQTINVESNMDYLVEFNFLAQSRFVKMRIQIIYPDSSLFFRDFGFFENIPFAGKDQFIFNSKGFTSVIIQILFLTVNEVSSGFQLYDISCKKAGNKVILEFPDPHPFLIGDEIRINKTDKTINPQYDTFVNVINSTTFSVTTDLDVGERSVVPQTGFIINLIRNRFYSPTASVFNGTRQYEELNKDFNQFIMGTESNGKFLHTTNKRVSRMSDFSTLSFIVSDGVLELSGEENGWKARIRSFLGGTESNVYFLDPSDLFKNKNNRFDIPSGIANLERIPRVPAIQLFNKDYYIIDIVFNEVIGEECFYFVDNIELDIFNSIRFELEFSLEPGTFFNYTSEVIDGQFKLSTSQPLVPISYRIRERDFAWSVTTTLNNLTPAGFISIFAPTSLSNRPSIDTTNESNIIVKLYGDFIDNNGDLQTFSVIDTSLSSGVTWTTINNLFLNADTSSVPISITASSPFVGSVITFEPNVRIYYEIYPSSGFFNFSFDLSTNQSRVWEDYSSFNNGIRITSLSIPSQILQVELNGVWTTVQLDGGLSGTWTEPQTIGNVTGARKGHFYNGQVYINSSYLFTTAPLTIVEFGSGTILREGELDIECEDITESRPISEEFIYEVSKDCGETVQLCWLNRYGGVDYYTFEIRSKRRVDVNRNSYRKSYDYFYKIGDSGNEIYNMDVQEVWNVFSMADDIQSKLIREMVESPKVYLLRDTIIPELSNPLEYLGEMIPVIITNDTIDYQDGDLVEYDIELTLSNKKIINI